MNVLGKSDPLIKDALTIILERGGFINSLTDDTKEPLPGKSNQGLSPAFFQTLNDYDPQIVSDLIGSSQASIDELRQDIQTKSGPVLFDFILEDIEKSRKSLSESQSLGVIMTAMNAAWWINEKMLDWLAEKTQPTRCHRNSGGGGKRDEDAH